MAKHSELKPSDSSEDTLKYFLQTIFKKLESLNERQLYSDVWVLYLKSKIKKEEIKVWTSFNL